MANLVTEARVHALLTKESLAMRAGVHSDTIRAAERGDSISLLSQERIAQALGYPRSALFPEPELEEATG